MIRRIFSIIAIAFLAVTTFIALPTTARAEGWFQQQYANQASQEQYSPDNSYSPNNDQSRQDELYAQNQKRNSPNNDEQQQSSSFLNNQSNQGKGQNQQQSPSREQK